MGTDNIELAKFLLTQKFFTPGAEITSHFDLDRIYPPTVQAWANVVKEKMGETAITSVSVLITMPGLSLREVASSMRKLRIFKEVNELESATQNFCSI